MREIKFRGKRIDTGDWVYGHYFVAPLTDENSGLPAESGWFFLSNSPHLHCIAQNGVSFVIDEKTLGQYTGLKDKNGVDIYEGDNIKVVTSTDAVCEEWTTDVAWEDYAFVVKGNGVDYYDTWLAAYGSNDGYPLSEIEVIGNIYENHEVIEVRP